MANITEEEVRQIIREELSFMIKNNSLVFPSPIRLADNVHISCSGVNGSKFGTTNKDKIAFYGATPVVQSGAISSPSGGLTVDSQARSAIDVIRIALQNFGITA